jgi:hypothetical protein
MVHQHLYDRLFICEQCLRVYENQFLVDDVIQHCAAYFMLNTRVIIAVNRSG